ncbi:hypothetical protein HHO41_00130 [Bacillus sp. DNRA2]|uniref:hypothetical protein n=1 Tax=Bacillus sp. DNRA2 TaxID=2723053 RepID=UPI00145D2C8E|nr:hypothetical protein [Bacillus sp. DNRA2]NMD68675.1 hypothetical protein [Bacillus sp. DNRA2]
MINIGRKALITSGIVIVLSAGGIITYLSNDNSNDKATTNQTSSAKSTAVASETKSEAFMRNAPIESIILGKFYYGDDANKGANSKTSAASSNKTSIDEQLFISASEKFISAELLNRATAYIGRSKSELEATNTANPEHIELIYNGKNVVEAVTLDITPTTPKNLIKYVGKPSYQLKDEAYLYHGQTYDFIIYTNEGKKFTKLTLLPVLEQSELKQDNNAAVVADQETTEEQSDTVSPSKNKKNSDETPQKPARKNASTTIWQTKPSGTSSSSPAPAVPGNSNATPAPPQDNGAPATPTVPEDPKPDPTPTPEPPKDPTPSEPPGDTGSEETPTAPAQ